MAPAKRTGIIDRIMDNREVILIMAVIAIVFMMVIPLPTFVLDVLLALNLSVALIILVLAIYTEDTLSFSTFPSLLLVVTLFRLALNISGTRLILLHGFAGHVIEAFGNFVIGGNAVVGFIVFFILVIVQFIVITKGAERVAEVAARFTLDAMPGKQMSIDADLNAGIITDLEAKERRQKIQREADFYGAMDGASKFVKGDAIASIVIVFINVTGGFIVGMLQLGMSAGEALSRFTLLTVGEGLVNQMPALLISTATGLIVTRAASDSNLGKDLIRQIFSRPKPLIIAAIVLTAMAFLPGMPTFSFLGLAGFFAGVVVIMRRMPQIALEDEGEDEEPDYEKEAEELKKPENVLGLLQVEPIEFEFGYGLLPFADPAQGGPLMDRIVMIRRQCALELGVVVPTVRIRDNMQLKPNIYVLKIKGIEVAQYELLLGHYLALDTGGTSGPLNGLETVEPAFNLKAFWITEEEREMAETTGYTVVDIPTVVSTHITEIIKKYAHELIGRQEVKKLLDNVQKEYPAVVDDLVPNVLSLGELQKVMQNLLKERISIRDLVSILETLADYGNMTRDTDVLTEYVRQTLARQITQQFSQGQRKISVITIDASVESAINDAIRRTDQGAYLSIDPQLAAKIVQNLSSLAEKTLSQGISPIVICAPVVRVWFRRLIERSLPHVTVLSYNEIDQDVEVQSIGTVSM